MNFIKNLFRRTSVLLLVLVMAYAMTGSALAQNLTTGGSGLQIPTGGAQISSDIVQDRTLGETITLMVNYFTGFLGFVAVIVFVYAGVLWVVSGGNEDQITKAKKMMTYAALGLVVVILSYTIVTFITSSAQGERAELQCTLNEDCINPEGGQCIAGMCQYPQPSNNQCTDDSDCPVNLGFICGAAGTCEYNPAAASLGLCSVKEDCPTGTVCYNGSCRSSQTIFGGTQSCVSDAQCPTGYQCRDNFCRIPNSVTGTNARPAFEDSLTELDRISGQAGSALDQINNLLGELPAESREEVDALLSAGSLNDKIARLNDILGNTSDVSVAEALESMIAGLLGLRDSREELDKLKDNMPESEAINTTYAETSEALNGLIDDPKSGVKLRRFQTKYRELKELIRRFPVVQARIRGVPSEGNVPFTVVLDALDSVDPTGGTLSEYKWSYLDNQGNEISLGSAPVVVQEFTEPNTYSIRMRASTSQRDANGYKTAADAVSVVRVKANPPAAKVTFRVNGTETSDVYHLTQKEAEAGITFDPSQTTPALGRTIAKYEWSYGDTVTETRSTATPVVHTYTRPGEYFVQLQTTDNLGTKDKRIIKLFIKSVAANVNFTPRVGNVNTEFTFRGVRSRSDEGMIRDYQWEIQSEEGQIVFESDQPGFRYKFDRPGVYKIILLVTDITSTQDTMVETIKIESRPPVANFSYSTPQRNRPNQLEFNAIDSYDPDEGDRVFYSWDFDGNGEFEIVKSTEAQVMHTFTRKGEFRLKLQVEDQSGKFDLIDKRVAVDSILSADIQLEKPVGLVNQELVLTVTNSNAIAYLWEFGDGETTSTDASTVRHIYKKKGRYTVKLNFFDRDNNENSDTTTVVIGDADEPIASIEYRVNDREGRIVDDLCGLGRDGVILTRSNLVRFDGATSVNTDGTNRLLAYDWRFSDGNRSSQREFNHKFTELTPAGQCLSVALTVRDQVSGKVSPEEIAYFRVENELPQITDFVINADEVAGKELVTPAKARLRAVTPKDADGSIRKYQWWYYREGFPTDRLGLHFTSKPETEMILTAQGEPDVAHQYFFVVEITDNDNGVFNSSERFGELSTLTVKNGPNLSPVVDFTMDKTSITAGDSITFISNAYDPQGDTLTNDSFRWDFDGDGQFDDVSSGAQVSRQFNTPGEYDVRLRVVNRGLATTTIKKIYVQPSQALPQPAFTYVISGSTVNFDASPTRYDDDLADSTIRFEWDFDVETDANGNGINDDDVESTELRPSYTYTENKRYRARLKAKDSLGSEGVVVRDINLSLSTAQREQNTATSLIVTSTENPITTLTITLSPMNLQRGDTAEVSATVVNADGTPYAGDVFFEIVNGSGDFFPSTAKAVDSRATAIFSSSDVDPTRVRVRATNTNYGELTEEGTFQVR